MFQEDVTQLKGEQEVPRGKVGVSQATGSGGGGKGGGGKGGEEGGAQP